METAEFAEFVELTVADGRVESAGDGVVTGWAWSPPAPDVRVRIVVWVNGRIAASGLADRPTPGLEKIGLPDDRHGFAIELPEELAGEHEELAVAVRVAGVSERLSMVPGWNEQADGAWAAARMVVDDRPAPTPPMADDAPPNPEEPATAALAGRDGWLFAHPRDGHPRTEIDDVAADLQRSAEALAMLGIRYVVAIAPPKLAVYPDRVLHAAVPASGVARALQQLSRDSDVLEVLDLREVLADARRHGDLYLPRDERWSALGALHVQRALIKRAGLHGLRPTAFAEAAFAESLEPPLAALIGLPLVGPDGDNSEPSIPDGIDASAQRAQRVPAGEHLETEGLPEARVYENPGSEDLPRAVLVGDPCVHAVAPWLAEACSRLVVLSSASAPMVAIELEHPPVVFHLLEERRIGA